jgi:hypothetical protein
MLTCILAKPILGSGPPLTTRSGEVAMPRIRFVPKIPGGGPTTPFETAEEAWFWYVRCQKMRREGVRFRKGDGSLQRPCEPDDVYNAVAHLLQIQVINSQHVDALVTCGLRERPPDPRLRMEETMVKRWEEALDRLTTLLRKKGIVSSNNERCQR